MLREDGSDSGNGRSVKVASPLPFAPYDVTFQCIN